MSEEGPDGNEKDDKTTRTRDEKQLPEGLQVFDRFMQSAGPWKVLTVTLPPLFALVTAFGVDQYTVDVRELHTYRELLATQAHDERMHSIECFGLDGSARVEDGPSQDAGTAEALDAPRAPRLAEIWCVEDPGDRPNAEDKPAELNILCAMAPVDAYEVALRACLTVYPSCDVEWAGQKLVRSHATAK